MEKYENELNKLQIDINIYDPLEKSCWNNESSW